MFFKNFSLKLKIKIGLICRPMLYSIIRNFHIYIYIEGTCILMVIVKGNGLGERSSNPGQTVCSTNIIEKGRKPSRNIDKYRPELAF